MQYFNKHDLDILQLMNIFYENKLKYLLKILKINEENNNSTNRDLNLTELL